MIGDDTLVTLALSAALLAATAAGVAVFLLGLVLSRLAVLEDHSRWVERALRRAGYEFREVRGE